MSEQKECWSTANPMPCNEETVKSGRCGCRPFPKSEQNHRLSPEQITDKAKNFADAMADGKKRLGKYFRTGLMIGYDSGYWQALKDAGKSKPSNTESEQNEKLTLQATMMKHGVLDGYRNVQNIESAMKDYAAQQVEHATAELRHECEQLGKLLTTANGAIKYQKDKAEELLKELEEMKKRVEESDRLAKSWRDKRVEVEYLEDVRMAILESNSGMSEYFRMHDYRSMWDLWVKVTSRVSPIGIDKSVQTYHELKTQLAEAQRQRDEFLNLLNGLHSHIGTFGFVSRQVWINDYRDRIPRLSSGETKNEQL